MGTTYSNASTSSRAQCLWTAGIAGLMSLGAIAIGIEPALAFNNPTLEVGVVQRFGTEPDRQKLEFSALAGGLLTLEFENEVTGQLQRQQTDSVTIAIVNRALTAPETVQRLVLSSHRSFESAAASALYWNGLGVETEIVQPDEWQVWADRDEYTPSQLIQIQIYARDNDIPSVRPYEKTMPFSRELSWTWEGQTYTSDTLSIVSDRGVMDIDSKPFAGDMRIQPNAHESFTVVNSVPLETYLRGVVPHEIGYQAPRAAVEAQAILARTYALRNRHRFLTDDYEICATTHCQVYRGLTETRPMADQAIAATAGQVLTYDDELADAVYSSTTGGVTAAFEHIWDGDPRPYLQSVPDTSFQGHQMQALDLSQETDFRRFLTMRQGFNEVGRSSFFRWEESKTIAELSANLKVNQKYLGIALPFFQKIVDMQVMERSPSGRVQKLQVDLLEFNGKVTPVTLRKDMILLALRSPGLEPPFSTLFSFDPVLDDEDNLTGYNFVGGGLGHGVGMSQIGSYNLAAQGYSAREILQFYYSGAALTTLNDRLASINTPAQ
ncbi:MAG: SpoIID/LytB domain-containing protein [Cyanobacteria bacterium J06639_1]